MSHSNLPPMPFGSSEDLNHLDEAFVTVGMRELVHKSNPAHVRVQVFVGDRPGSRGSSGELTLRRSEWDRWCEQVDGNAFNVAHYVEILDALDLEDAR